MSPTAQHLAAYHYYSHTLSTTQGRSHLTSVDLIVKTDCKTDKLSIGVTAMPEGTDQSIQSRYNT